MRAQSAINGKAIENILGVKDRFDHFVIDVKGRRLFVAALGNNSLEVIDQRRAGIYQLRERIPTRTGARTSFLSRELHEGQSGSPALRQAAGRGLRHDGLADSRLPPHPESFLPAWPEIVRGVSRPLVRRNFEEVFSVACNGPELRSSRVESCV